MTTKEPYYLIIQTMGGALHEVHTNRPEVICYVLDIDRPNTDVPDEVLIACDLNPEEYRNGRFFKY